MNEEIVITANGILWILGAIGIIGAATLVLARWVKPFQDLKARVEKLEAFQNADHKDLKKVETGIEKICKCTLAITDHELTGNGFDKLEEARTEMNEYLITK